MDILPAIPFSKEYYGTSRRLNDAYNSMTVRKDLALLATDKDKQTSEYHYIPTNPRGYAEWFKERMQVNTRKVLTDSVERVPAYPKKNSFTEGNSIVKTTPRCVLFYS